MDKNFLKFHLKGAAINLAPSAVILAVIALGAALHVSWFELSWNNDVLFVLLAFAALLPLTKLPMMFLKDERPLFWEFGIYVGESAQERDAQIELLEHRLKDSSLAVKDSTQ